MLCGRDEKNFFKKMAKYKMFSPPYGRGQSISVHIISVILTIIIFTIISNNIIVTENRRRRRRRSSGRKRRVGLRQVDGIAFGRRRSGTARARGQAALDAVEEKLVVVVFVAAVVGSPVVQVTGPGGHRRVVRRLLYFVDGRQDRFLAGFHQAAALPHEISAPEKFLGGGLCANGEKKKFRKNRAPKYRQVNNKNNIFIIKWMLSRRLDSNRS